MKTEKTYKFIPINKLDLGFLIPDQEYFVLKDFAVPCKTTSWFNGVKFDSDKISHVLIDAKPKTEYLNRLKQQDLRRCGKCKAVKNPSEFYSKMNRCIACQNIKEPHKHDRMATERKDGTRTCTRCKELKSLDNYRGKSLKCDECMGVVRPTQTELKAKGLKRCKRCLKVSCFKSYTENSGVCKSCEV